MRLKTLEGQMKLSHFPVWALFMWLSVGSVCIAIGISIRSETPLYLVFIIAGSLSAIGTLFLKKVSVVFDKNANTVERCWQAWIGILKRTKTIPMDKISSIVYEREITYASVNKTGKKQRFFLFAEISDDSKFYFFPITYTPCNAEKKGNEIATFLGVPFKTEETKTESAVRRSRRQDEN